MPPKPNLKGKSETKELGKTRRRLSVVSDNRLVEGLSGLQTDESAVIKDSGAKNTQIIESFAGVSKKGYAPYNPRKKNQDSLIMETHEETGSLLLCVFDGHGEAGDGVSTFFKNQLPKTLFSHPSFENDIKTALNESIQMLEKSLLRDSSIDTEFSGTTAVMSIIRGNRIYCGNIGDSRMSRGFVDGGKIIGKQISDDHKPERPDEKARILQKGGRVFAVEYDDGIDGPARVWLGHMDVPGLAMSRSLGDTVAHSAGVISEIEWWDHEIGPEDKFLVLASDGLWEFMTDQEVIDMIDSTPKEPRKAVDILIAEANGRWMKEEQVIDDTTVIVAVINQEQGN